jgi:glycosyltransferase involved in cell wall biosynthesis
MNKVIISIIIPIYNEEQALKKNFYKIYKFLSKNFISFEIILIESGSSDKSNLLCKHYSKLKNIKFLNQIKREGFGSAIKLAIKKISGEYFCVIPIDLCFDLKILKILNKKKFDLLTSYRMSDNRGFFRLIQSNIYNKYIKFIFGLNFKCVNSVPKILKTKFIKNKKIYSRGWTIDAELLYHYKNKHLKREELKVNLLERKYGNSKIEYIDIIKIIFNSLIVRLKIFIFEK